MDEKLLEILQKLADELDNLKKEVKSLSDKISGIPSVPPVSEPPKSSSWVEDFRARWAIPTIDSWPSKFGEFPWDSNGLITVAKPLNVVVENENQLSLIVELAKWGFAPSKNNPVTPTAWSIPDLSKIWKKLKVLLDLTEEQWQNSLYAKYNVEPDFVAFITCVEHFDPNDPTAATKFGVSSQRVDKLAGKNLADYLKKEYFSERQAGGTPGIGGQ